MQSQALQQQSQPSSNWRSAARAIGWVLLIPAALLTVFGLVIPTARTFDTSLRSGTFIGDVEPERVGFTNYGIAFDHPLLWPSLWYSLSLMAVPIIVALVVAPLLAAAVSWAGGWARLTARVALSLPLVVFSPVAVAVAWRRMLLDEPERLADTDLAGGTIRLSVAMMAFGVLCAIGLMLFLPVFRARAQQRPMWPGLFAVAGVLFLGLLAVALQQFTVPYVLTRFGPANATMTPVGLMYETGFVGARLGIGAAVGMVLLAVLAVLGVAAVLIVVLTRFRVTLLPSRQRQLPDDGAIPQGPPGRTNPVAIAVAALVLVVVLVAVVLNARPWLAALPGSAPETPPGTQLRTWLPAILGALLSVGVAYLAALGISGLRPLGRHSEWLLLPFAPWLFVGVAPLSIGFFLSLRDEGGLNTSTGLYPPILVSIVSLLILAVVCRGQSERWQHEVATGASPGATFFRTVVLPTLPLAGLLFVVTMLVNAQDLLWPLLVSISPEHDTTVMTLIRNESTFAARRDISVAAATPLLAVVLGVAALVAVQVLHLDRMVATTGRTDETSTR